MDYKKGQGKMNLGRSYFKIFCVPFILGEDGENALMEHIKEDSGLIATDKVLTEFREILDKIKENNEIKKSSSSQA